jgi:hypothetical protein
LGPPLAVVPVVTGDRAGGRALRASEKGGYPHHGVRAASWGGRAPAITRAVPGARLCTWSTGSRSWRRVEVVVLAEGRPDHQAVVLTERTATSPWPASRETVSSVRKSPTPDRSTLTFEKEQTGSLAGVDRVPPALAVAPPSRADRRCRALGRVPVVVAVDEAVAPTSLRRPGACVVVHSRDRTSAL